jgi:AmiR/NasT family two-component response regulator
LFRSRIAVATAALADTVERRQPSRGLAIRTGIRQATGIVMEQFDLDATTAFAVRRRLSQTHNDKCAIARNIATRLIE